MNSPESSSMPPKTQEPITQLFDASELQNGQEQYGGDLTESTFVADSLKKLFIRGDKEKSLAVNKNTARRMLIPGRPRDEAIITDAGLIDQSENTEEVVKADTQAIYGYHVFEDQDPSTVKEGEAPLKSLRPTSRRERRNARRVDNKRRANLRLAASNRRFESIYNVSDPTYIAPETPEIKFIGPDEPGIYKNETNKVRDAVNELLRRERLLKDRDPRAAAPEIAIGTERHARILEDENMYRKERKAAKKNTRKYRENLAQMADNRDAIKDMALSGEFPVFYTKKRYLQRRADNLEGTLRQGRIIAADVSTLPEEQSDSDNTPILVEKSSEIIQAPSRTPEQNPAPKIVNPRRLYLNAERHVRAWVTEDTSTGSLEQKYQKARETVWALTLSELPAEERKAMEEKFREFKKEDDERQAARQKKKA